MRESNRWVLAALLLIFIGGCACRRGCSDDSTDLCRGVPGCMTDGARLELLTEQTVLLMESGEALKADQLRKQLDRTHHRIPLSEASAQKKTPAEIYKQCCQSIVAVGGLYKCDECTKWHCGAATGFFLSSSGVVATNYHVVANKGDQAYGVMTQDGEVYGVKAVLAADRANDIAILQIDGAGFTPLALSDYEEVGMPVTLISHPGNRYYMLTDGIVSRYTTEKAHGVNVDRMQITADFARGSSGGPVLNECGSVVGMVRATDSIYYHEEKGTQENLQMVVKTCIPANAIRAMLETPDTSAR